MGWTVVEPLSPGVFQIDPSVYGAEQLRVFHAGGTAAAKTTAKVAAAALKKMKKLLKESMETAVKLKVGLKVDVKVSSNMTAAIEKRAAKLVDTKFPGLKGEGGSSIGRRQNLINGEAKKLGNGYADNLAKKLDADDLAKGLDVDDVAGFNKWADDAAKASKGLADEVLTPAEKAAAKAARKKAAAKNLDEAGTGNNKGLSEGQKQIYRMANRTGLSVIGMWGAFTLLLPVAEAASEVVGDGGEGVLTIFTGENCRQKVEANYPSNPEVWSEKTEVCESQAAFRTMLMGGAAVSLLGVLGVVLVTRLIPKKSTDDEEEPEE